MPRRKQRKGYTWDNHQADATTEASSSRVSRRSDVWWLQGLGHTRARLQVKDGRLRLSTAAERVFEVPLTDARITKPWWWFGGGFHIEVEGRTYKVSFVRPNGEANIAARVGTKALGQAAGPLVFGQLAAMTADIRAGRRDVMEWSSWLSQQGVL